MHQTVIKIYHVTSLRKTPHTFPIAIRIEFIRLHQCPTKLLSASSLVHAYLTPLNLTEGCFFILLSRFEHKDQHTTAQKPKPVHCLFPHSPEARTLSHDWKMGKWRIPSHATWKLHTIQISVSMNQILQPHSPVHLFPYCSELLLCWKNRTEQLQASQGGWESWASLLAFLLQKNFVGPLLLLHRPWSVPQTHCVPSLPGAVSPCHFLEWPTLTLHGWSAKASPDFGQNQEKVVTIALNCLPQNTLDSGRRDLSEDSSTSVSSSKGWRSFSRLTLSSAQLVIPPAIGVKGCISPVRLNRLRSWRKILYSLNLRLGKAKDMAVQCSHGHFSHINTL